MSTDYITSLRAVIRGRYNRLRLRTATLLRSLDFNMDVFQSFDRAVHSAMKRGLGNVDKNLFYQIHQRAMRVRGLTIPQLNTIFTTSVYEQKDMTLNKYHKTITEFFRLFCSNMDRAMNVETSKLTYSKLNNSDKPAHSKSPSSQKSVPTTSTDKKSSPSLSAKSSECSKSAHITKESSGTTHYSFGFSRKDDVFVFGRDPAMESASSESNPTTTLNNGELLLTCQNDIDQLLAARRIMRSRGCASVPLVDASVSQPHVCADTSGEANGGKKKHHKKPSQTTKNCCSGTAVASMRSEHVKIVDANTDQVIGIHGTNVPGQTDSDTYTIIRGKRQPSGTLSASGSSTNGTGSLKQVHVRKPRTKKSRSQAEWPSQADRQYAREAMARATVHVGPTTECSRRKT